MRFNAVLEDLEATHLPRDDFPNPLTEQQKSDFRTTIMSCLAQDFTLGELQLFLPAANLQYSNLKKAKTHAQDSNSYPLYETKTVAHYKLKMFQIEKFGIPSCKCRENKKFIFLYLSFLRGGGSKSTQKKSLDICGKNLLEIFLVRKENQLTVITAMNWSPRRRHLMESHKTMPQKELQRK